MVQPTEVTDRDGTKTGSNAVNINSGIAVSIR